MDWRSLETFSFGDGPALADELAALVLEGKKTATCWAASQGLLTQVGKRMIMLDGAGRCRAVIETVELVERLKSRRPEIAIGADLIAGFPTETDDMAANSLALIDDCDIVMGHIFPYSAKVGTPAARMPQVAPLVIKARAKGLREASANRRASWLANLVNSRQRVLIEREDGNGHAENFAPVRVRTEGESRIGEIVAVKVTGIEDDRLIGVAE